MNDGNSQAGLDGMYTTFRANVPQLYIDIDRDQVLTKNVAMSAVFNALAILLRIGLHERLHLHESRVPGEGAGRPEVPYGTQTDSAIWKSATATGNRCRSVPLHPSRRFSGHNRSTATTCIHPPKSWVNPAKASVPARPWQLWRIWPPKSCRPPWAWNGRNSPSRKRPLRVRPTLSTSWPSFWSISCWPRSMKAGAFRFPSACRFPPPCSAR